VTPLPAALGGKDLIAWRLDRDIYAPDWDSGQGSYKAGGRWSSKGVRAVDCAMDPSTAILEVAVHKGFDTLDRVRHVMTSMVIAGPADIHVINEADIPDKNWLRPVTPTPAQQAFGDGLLAAHKFVLIPSAVSHKSWNLIFLKDNAKGAYALRTQEPFVLDGRLNPASP